MAFYYELVATGFKVRKQEFKSGDDFVDFLQDGLQEARDALEAQLAQNPVFEVVSHSVTLSVNGEYGVVTFLLRRE